MTTVEIQLQITGTTPLLCNRFSDEAAMDATNGTRSSLTGDAQTPQEIAQGKLYLDSSGKPCIPQPNLFRSIIDAGKFFKNGKSKVTTLKTSIIPSCVELEGVTYAIKHKDPWRVDTRPVRIPSTGGRILCHRPCFDDWQLDVVCNLDTAEMGEKLFRQIVDKGGKAVGLGDFRPDCKGPFGKYVVTKWQSKRLNGG